MAPAWDPESSDERDHRSTCWLLSTSIQHTSQRSDRHLCCWIKSSRILSDHLARQGDRLRRRPASQQSNQPRWFVIHCSRS